MSNPVWGPIGITIDDHASGFVADQFNLAQGFAVESYYRSFDLLAELGTILSPIDLGPDITLDMNYYTPDTIILEQPTPPVIPPYTAILPSVPVIGDLTLGTIDQLPAFDVPPPDIQFPVRPSTDLPAAPSIDTTFVSPQIPGVPSFTLPDLPVFSAITFPDPPSDIIADLDAIAPVDNLIVPSNAFSYYESRYVSALLDVARAWLSDEITNGGTGLTAESQADIYAMETERDLQAIADAMDREANIWAQSNWSLPDGILEASLFALNLDYMQRRMDKSRDIRVEAEKLAIQQLQFAVSQAQIVEGMLINYENQISQRAFETAKATMDYALAVYDAALKKYQVDLETYKAKAAVFEVKIRAAIANAELYKARLEAIKVMVEVNQQQVEIYKAQLQGIGLLIDIYKTEMEASKLLAEIEALKLQAAKLQVDIYVAEVGAKTAEYNMYEAAIKGELGRAQVYAVQVDAFKTRVEEAKIQADLVIETARIKNEVAKTLVSIYSEEIAAYKAQIEATAVQIDGLVKEYTAETGVYEADARVKIGMGELGVKVFEARITQAKAQADIALKDLEVKLQILLGEMSLREKAMEAAATVASHLAAGAMAGAHAQAHVGYSSSESLSASSGFSQSNSSNWSEES